MLSISSMHRRHTEDFSQLACSFLGPEYRKKYFVYHDESGTDHQKKFELHGALFIPASKINQVYQSLLLKRGDYDGQIHYSDLRDKSSSKSKSVAQEWMKTYFQELVDSCPYKCFVIEFGSPHLRSQHKHDMNQLYNFGSEQAIYGGLCWFFANIKEIELSIYYEIISKPNDDNLQEYLLDLLANKSRKNFKCPVVYIPEMKFHTLSGNPKKVNQEERIHCEFLQLTDLLTGSINNALTASASQEVKNELSLDAARYIEDVKLVPWFQEHNLHRKFSVSIYPDKNGRVFAPILEVNNLKNNQYMRKLPGF